MKINSLIFLSALALLALSCSDDDENDKSLDIPTCVQTHLTTFQSDQANCEGASLKSYDFQDILVYAFEDGNCIADGGIWIIDDGCSDICFIGGIAGLTDCNGQEFSSTAVLREVIWSSE